MRALARVSPRVWVGLAFAFVGWQTLFDYDIGLALANGRWMFEHVALPTTNVFSPHFESLPWVNDKWLFHGLAHLLIDGIGPLAAKLVRCAVLFVLGFTIAAPCTAWTPFLGFTALLAAHERFGFRPELLTLTFVAFFIRLLARKYALTRKGFVALCVVQVVWVNVHGFWVVGPILAAATAVGAWLDGRLRSEPRDDAKARWALPFALVACAFVNPYGLALVRSPIDILLDLKANKDVYAATITEFVPPWSAFDVLPYDLLAYRVLAIVALLAALGCGKRLRLVEVLPLLALFAMSLEIRRNAAPFAVAAVPIVAVWLTRVRGVERPRRVAVGAGALVAAFIAAAHVTDHLYVHDGLDRSFFERNEHRLSPRIECAWMLERLPDAPLFNSFSFGSTFQGVAYPRRRAFIDGNTAGYPVRFLAEYAEFVTARGDAAAFVRRYGIEQCLMKPGHPVLFELLKLGFHPVFGHAQAVVLVADDPRYRPVVAATDVARDVFPGPAGVFARADLGLALWRAGRFDEALRILDAALAERELPLLHFRRALALHALSRTDEAKAAAARALALDPGLAQAADWLSRLR